MSVTLTDSLITFPPMSVEAFTPIHEAIVGLDIEEITGIIDGEVKVAGILVIDCDVQHVYTIVKRFITP
jgi:hypothetical protein